MAFCTKCGNQLREGNAFCTKCGARVRKPVAEEEKQQLEKTASAQETQGPKVPQCPQEAEKPEEAETPRDPQVNQPTDDSAEAGRPPIPEELQQTVEMAKEGVTRAAERIKAAAKETAESFKSAESGEDTKDDPMADQVSDAILGAAKWSKRQYKNLKNLNTDSVKQWQAKNSGTMLAVAVVLILVCCLSMFSCIGGTASSTAKSAAKSSSAGYSPTSAPTATTVTTTPAKKTYATHIKVKCNKNLLFSTYDVQVYIDDSLVGTVDHGDECSWDKELTEGSHQIKVCKKGDKDIDGTKTFEVTAETILECTVSTSSSQVEFKEFSCQTKEEIERAAAEAEKKRQEEAQAKLETQQYVSDGTGATYKVQFSISGWINTLFLKARSINIYLDGSQVKTVADGETTEWEQDLGGGQHTLRFASADDDSVDVMQAFTVADISYLNCKASLGLSGVEVEDYAFETQTERDKAAEEAQQKAAAEAEAKAKREAEAAEKAKVLTVENCQDLASLLTSSSSDASAFAAAYSGQTIEFDGNIAYMSSHNGAKTRFDVLIYAGDYSETSAKGPHMQYKDVNYRDMGASGIDSVQMGLNVRIRAKVGSYNSSSDILSLTPVSMTAR